MKLLSKLPRTKEEIIKLVLIVVCIWYSLFLTLTYIKASSYSIPATDDFAAKGKISGVCAPISTQIDNAVEATVNAYEGWQGTYFTYFTGELLNPLNNYGARQLRYTMTAFSSFFFVGLMTLLLTVMFKGLNKQYALMAILVCAVIHSVCGYEAYPEIFSWFAGSITYCVPLAMILIGLAMCIVSDGFNKWIPFILAMLIGPLAMGGVLIDVAIGCYGCLLLCAFYTLISKKISIRAIIVFVEWVAFALVNALAPGNFTRHTNFDNEGLKPFEALHNAFLIGEQRWQFLLGKGYAAVLLIVLICGLLAKIRNENQRTALGLAALGLLTPFVAGFPLALGYSDSRVPNRCAFSIDVSIILSSVLFVFCLGVFLAGQFSKDSIRLLICNVALLAVVCLMLDGYGYSGIKAVEIREQLKREEYQERYRTCKYLLEELAEYENGSDVEVPIDKVPKNIENAMNFYLETDSDNRWNQEMASYFELNSISVVE